MRGAVRAGPAAEVAYRGATTAGGCGMRASRTLRRIYAETAARKLLECIETQQNELQGIYA